MNNTLKDKTIKDESYKEVKFQQLLTAHSSSILLYSRQDSREKESRSKELARKLRPEFGKVFLATEVKECFKLLHKHDVDDSLPAIELIIADLDIQSLKLLDYVNMRPKNKDTAQYPIISTIILLPEDLQLDKASAVPNKKTNHEQSIEQVGGASAVHANNVHSKDLLLNAVEILARRKHVELAFRDLKAAKVKGTKHKYLPLFSTRNHDMKGDDISDDDLDGFSSASTTRKKGKGVASGGNKQDIGSVGTTASLEDMDDWTETSSLLPEFVTENRERIKQKQRDGKKGENAYAFAPQKGVDILESVLDSEIVDFNQSPKRERRNSQDIRDRQMADRNLVKFIQTGHTLEQLESTTTRPLTSKEIREEKEQKQKAASDLEHSRKINKFMENLKSPGGTPAGSRNGSILQPAVTDNNANPVIISDGVDPNETVQPQTTTVSAEKISTIEEKSSSSLPPVSSTLPVSPLMNPISPLKKQNQNQNQSLQSHEDENSQLSLDEADKHQRARNNIVNPLFMKRGQMNSLTALLEPKNRPTWKMQGEYMSNDLSEQGLDFTELGQSSKPKGKVDIYPFIKREKPRGNIVHSVGGLDNDVAIDQWKIINSSNYEMSTVEQIGSLSENASVQTTSDTQNNDEGLDNSCELSLGGSINSQFSQLFQDTDEQYDTRLNTKATKHQYKKGVDPMLVTNATKTLKRMARDTAPDVQLNDLIPILLTHGKVSIGDKDILEAGLKAEKEGNTDLAITMYKRAGLHTKFPHLSKMFLAFVHYTTGKFMQALDYLTNAIDSQEKIRHMSVFVADDQFIAYYNRALVNFRLGNDDKGLVDIREAINLNQSNLQAREILSLALRRVGKYGESIERAKQNAVIRKENEFREQERILLEKAKTDERKLTSKSNIKGSGNLRSMSHGSLSLKRGDSIASTKGDVGDGSISMASESGVLNNAVRKVHCPVMDRGGGTFKSLKLQRERALEQCGEHNGMPGEALKTFKLTNGFQDDLFEGLFTQPSSLQASLIVEPHVRSDEQIETIASKLRLFPFLMTCNDGIVKELARCVEYRALSNRDNIFTQNRPADGVCFILRGNVQGRLEGLEVSGGSKMLVCDMGMHDTIGHIDMLFDNPKGIVKDLCREIEGAKSKLMSAAEEALPEDMRDGPDKDKGKGKDGGLEEEELDGDDDESILPEDCPRAVQNRMFVTYTMTTLCEMLICSKNDYERLLHPIAYAEFQRRIEIVEACGVFKDWAKEEKIRLARMATVQVFHSGEMILKQGTIPNYAYLIMKGMCKSYKSPNKSTVLNVKLGEAQDKAARHDLKYTYHHKLRGSLSKGTLQIHPKSKDKKRLAGRTHVTVSEALRYSLGIEIKHLKRELAKAIEQEQRELEEEPSMDDIRESLTSKLSEVSTLQWPMLFGESVILDPTQLGTSRGTIVADTTLEVLCIHKSQLQTFRIRGNLLERLTHRSVQYPEDEELLEEKERKDAWEIKRQEIVRTLSTPKEEYLEPFYV